MSNLVIGNTSQLSFYFPENYIKISARNLDFEYLRNHKWDSVYLCFGESRKYIKYKKNYKEINFNLTLKIIDNLKNFTNKIVIYSTCELWNKCDGKINLATPFSFYQTPYLKSKFELTNYILKNKELYKNVIILYPFNFNSIHRNNNFLFGKIFDSIKNKKIIEIGDTYFYRDIIHPKFVVNESIQAKFDKIIGSGRLIFVNDFIRDLYYYSGLNYPDYVKENLEKFREYKFRKEYYLDSKINLYNYESLLKDTLQEIHKKV